MSNLSAFAARSVVADSIAAQNVRHLWRSEPLESFDYKAQGMLVSLGMDYAVVNVAGIKEPLNKSSNSPW